MTVGRLVTFVIAFFGFLFAVSGLNAHDYRTIIAGTVMLIVGILWYIEKDRDADR